MSQLGDDFGIRFRFKHNSLSFELLLQLAEVFNNTVMHHGHTVGSMRVGIVFRRLTVGCPTRMADARRSKKRLGR